MNPAGTNTTCLNCGATVTTEFCPHCGQKSNTKRLKLREIIGDFINSFVGGDNKFLNTLRGLCLRPGLMVREYLLGHRVKYYNPLQMLVFIITIYAIISFFMGDNALDLDGATDLPVSEISEEEDTLDLEKIDETIQNIWDYMKLLSENKVYKSVFTSFFGVFPFWLFFHKCKIQRQDGKMLPLNLTEQFYAQLYQSCLMMLIALLVLPLGYIPSLDKLNSYVHTYVSILINIIIYKQLLGIGWLKSSLLSILSSIVIGVLGITFFFVGVIVLCIIID